MYRSSNRSFPTLTSSALPYPKNVHTSARRKIIVIQSLLLFQNGIHRCTILHRSCPKLSWWWGYRDRSKAPVYVILCDSGSWDTMPRIHHEFQDMWLPRLQISSSLHLWRQLNKLPWLIVGVNKANSAITCKLEKSAVTTIHHQQSVLMVQFLCIGWWRWSDGGGVMMWSCHSLMVLMVSVILEVI